MRIRISVLFILAYLLSPQGIAQNKLIDSLKNRLKNEKQDTTKIVLELSICRAYESTGDFLQSLDYSVRALNQSKSLLGSSNSAIVLAAKKGEAKAYLNIGNSYNDQGNYNQAQNYYALALKAKEALGDKLGIANANNNLGLVCWSESNYPLALDYFLKSQNMYAAINNKSGMARTYNNIGLLYEEEGNNDSALSYFQKCLAIEKEQNDKEGIDMAYNNLGLIYHDQKKYFSALEYYFKSLEFRKELNNEAGIAITYTNIANIYKDLAAKPDSVKHRFIDVYYSEKNNHPSLNEIDRVLLDSALVLYQKGLKISQAAGDRSNIAASTLGIGQIYNARGDFKLALIYYKTASSIFKEINSKKNYSETLENISDCYKGLKQIDSAFVYFKLSTAIHDSVFNEDKQKEIGREEVKYAYEKKQALEEAESSRQHALEEEQRKRQQLIIYAGTGGLLLLIVFLVFVVQRLRITNRQKNIIGEQKEKIDHAFEQLGEAKKLLEERHKDLTDSIEYASRIQNALLTSDKYLSQCLNEYFILFKPKDIVSGDFYWALNHNGKFYIACCDCTGHGVPGAFMSLLNITFLHQAVIEKGISHPNEIFNEIRTNVVEALNPDDTSDTKDGMDATLCAIDFEKHLLQASCANNALWIIRNGGLIEFRPDKMPIGISGGESKPFTLHEMNLQKGDCIYMFSDGYADQFGGPDSKKFKQSRLKELVVSITSKPMREQKSILDKTFKDWKGDQMQIDDICLIGIRI
ncbi:MAG: tetratricopeptide repeat protein [Bacteroidia bacterium]